MSAAWTTESVTRFRDILALVSREQVRTAYEIAVKLKLPVSSTYLTVAEMERLSCLARDESGYLLVGIRPQQMALDALAFRWRRSAWRRWCATCATSRARRCSWPAWRSS